MGKTKQLMFSFYIILMVREYNVFSFGESWQILYHPASWNHVDCVLARVVVMYTSRSWLDLRQISSVLGLASVLNAVCLDLPWSWLCLGLHFLLQSQLWSHDLTKCNRRWTRAVNICAFTAWHFCMLCFCTLIVPCCLVVSPGPRDLRLAAVSPCFDCRYTCVSLACSPKDCFSLEINFWTLSLVYYIDKTRRVDW